MRCTPFLLPLLLFATVLALPMDDGSNNEAATSNQLSNSALDSDCSGSLRCRSDLHGKPPNDVIRDDVISLKDLEKDEEYLNQFRYYNYHEKEEPLLVSEIAQTLNVGEGDVRRAVRDTNDLMRIQLKMKEGEKAGLLADALKSYVQPVQQSLPKMIQTSIESVKVQSHADELYNYEDDWNMDKRIATILRTKKDNISLRLDFSTMIKSSQRGIRRYWKDLPLTDDRMTLYKKMLFSRTMPEFKNTFKVLETLQQARAIIRQQKSANPEKVIDDDSWMISLLPGLLKTDQIEIREAVQQARDETTFLNAVYGRRLATVRRFIEARKGFSDIKMEFRKAAKYTMYALEFEMLDVLLRHHAIGPFNLFHLLDAAISWVPLDGTESKTLAKTEKMVSFLLKYEQVGRHEIEWALWGLFIRNRHHLNRVKYDLVVDLFVKSGKITMEEVDHLIANFKRNVDTDLMKGGPINHWDVRT